MGNMVTSVYVKLNYDRLRVGGIIENLHDNDKNNNKENKNNILSARTISQSKTVRATDRLCQLHGVLNAVICYSK